MNSPAFFISYHRNDLNKAVNIYEFLSKHYAKKDIFFDQDKQSNPAGAKWEILIKQQIEKSTHFLIILTETTVKNITKSSFFLYEICMAIQKYKRLVISNFKIISIFVDTEKNVDLYPIPVLKDLNPISLKSDIENTDLSELLPETILHKSREAFFLKPLIKGEYEYILEKIEKKNRNFIIHGPSSIGKSSILKYLISKDEDTYVKYELTKDIDETKKKIQTIIQGEEPIILLDEFNTNHSEIIHFILNKGKNFICACKNTTNICPTILNNCEIVDMFFCDINNIIQFFSNTVKAPENKAKNLSRMCGGRLRIIEYFTDGIQQQESIETIINKSIKKEIMNFDEMWSTYDQETQQKIKAIAFFVDNAKVEQFQLNKTELTNRANKQIYNIEKLFSNDNSLEILQKDCLIEWDDDKEEITVTFALFFLWVRKYRPKNKDISDTKNITKKDITNNPSKKWPFFNLKRAFE